VARAVFVTNFCPHYRVKTYELLSRYEDIAYVFFSEGTEWYWLPQHGVRAGTFQATYLGRGRGLVGTALSLVILLWRDKYDVMIKCINGRVALPVSYLVARLRRKAFVLWTGIWVTLTTPFHRIARPFTNYIYRHADAVVVYGEHVKQFLVSQGVRPDRIFVAPHAVDNDAYAAAVAGKLVERVRADLGIGSGTPIVLYAGRLEDGKGLEYLLEAFAQVDVAEARLVLVGDGAQRTDLERAARRARLADRVVFAGYVLPEETPLYYAMAAVLVLPSISTPRGREPWGLVVNEAMNQGVPVIATEAVGAAAGGLVQNGVNGWVVPERDSLALARALRRTLRDPVLRAALSRGARRTIAGWDNERMVQGFRAAIAAVTAKG
jgi:glycosyltransferase involved in cell wall biosynthesis